MNNNWNDQGWKLIGNEQAAAYLDRSIASNKLAQSYIFSGPEDLGKSTVALSFARKLLCQGLLANQACGSCSSCLRFDTALKHAGQSEFDYYHSDLTMVRLPEGKKNISVEQIRDLVRALSKSSFSNSYKIGIIKQAEAMSIEAANALLKTLEEPKQKVIIILVVNDIDLLPKTISSRCQVVRFRLVKTEAIHDFLVDKLGANRSVAKNIAHFSAGRPALALKYFFQEDVFNKASGRAELFFDLLAKSRYERFQIVQSLKDDNAYQILRSWQGAARDLLMLFNMQDNLVQNEMSVGKIRECAKKFDATKVMRIMKDIEESIMFLQANVSPALCLEKLAVSI
jgi:DNA polymerase-3 subunit delta'